MRLVTVPLLALLSLAADGTRAPAAVPAGLPPAEPAAEEAVTEPAPAPLPVPVSSIRETDAPVPGDVKATVELDGAGGYRVKLARKGHLVALRHGASRAAAADTASIAIAAGEAEPAVWEATSLETLATVRGTLRVSDGKAGLRAKLHLAEAPVPAGRDAKRIHTCAAHEDGAGGFTVLCRIRANADAANVSAEDTRADVWTASAREARVVRLDLPASPAGAEARMVGYADGARGVVIRAEASRVAGEERPVLTLASADRAQPQIPRRTVRYRIPYYCTSCF
jgi:hypothetical protein